MPDTLSRVATPLLIWSVAGQDTGIGTADEALALIADGIIDPDGLTFRAERGSDRTSRIVFKPDLRREMAGLDWRVYTFGSGEWCEGCGHSGSFRTAAEAVADGLHWIETGLEAPARRRAAA